ncbi:unnamed protein product [Leptosia nina]|uniref:Uncharacterized protein n=1 Tax=Leptosia nina TaxID=320188 RepID=A0AAV1J6A6_9NEOP
MGSQIARQATHKRQLCPIDDAIAVRIHRTMLSGVPSETCTLAPLRLVGLRGDDCTLVRNVNPIESNKSCLRRRDRRRQSNAALRCLMMQ